MKITVSLLIAFICSNMSVSQTLQWRVLPNAPTNNIKIDDCFFINENTGWLANGQGPGQIYKTTNGGLSWSGEITGGYFRCIGFADSLKGWAGDLEINKIYQTINGGASWSTYILPSPAQSGTCGICVMDNNLVYACGRADGPAYFYKTTNGGGNWTAKDMSSLASVLVDCYFMNKDSGYVVGGAGTPYYANTKPVILYTSDGGTNWITRFNGALSSQWFWKMHHVNKDTIYAAIESWRFTDTASYAKTVNGGINWQEYSFHIDSSDQHMQGILFLKNGTGWIGGYECCFPSVTDGKTYQTTDNGITWTSQTWGFNVNRFRYVNDSVMYAVGRTVYKYSRYPIGIQPISTEVPTKFSLHQNFPNPFNPETKIRFEIPAAGTVPRTVRLIIYDALGREISTLVNEQLKAGVYEVSWNGANFPSGVYFYRLQTEPSAGSGQGFVESKKMILIK